MKSMNPGKAVEFKIDVNDFPNGIFILEAVDKEGYIDRQKFVTHQ